ncbi:hypothetical protein ACVWYH_009033 [Bradyrhizobium sp. GM24.11]
MPPFKQGDVVRVPFPAGSLTALCADALTVVHALIGGLRRQRLQAPHVRIIGYPDYRVESLSWVANWFVWILRKKAKLNRESPFFHRDKSGPGKRRR